MTEKKKANHLISIASLAILAETGNNLSMDEVTATAKAVSLITVDEIIQALNSYTFRLDMKTALDDIYYWQEVRNQIEK